MRLAVLFGAGASYGSGSVQPHPPPLGSQLYDELRKQFPDTWGKLVTPDEDAAFRDDPPFERGMGELWEKREERAQLLITDMALYFVRFAPGSQDNQYDELLAALQDSGVLATTVFCSLNYDCIFELVASRGGLAVDYRLGAPRPNSIAVLKPHGSCNFVMQGLGTNIQIENVRVSGAGAFYEAPLEARNPREVPPLYAAGPSMPPAISLYAPGKPTPMAPDEIDRIRQHWASAVARADLVISIGARVVLADTHVWDPVADSRAEVWYVGSPVGDDFATFEDRLGGRLTRLEARFNEAVPRIARRLQLLVR